MNMVGPKDFQTISGPREHEATPARTALEGAARFIFPARMPWWKRTLDLSAILLLSPGILLVGSAVALCIKLGSKGPVLFKQRRVGHKGRQFTCYKFRTMRPGAETSIHKTHVADLIASNKPMEKLDNGKDPRLIPGGRLLRASGLDELPQLFNVLCGEMSLVGPRPCIPYECEEYEQWHWRRFDVVPGLTGLWQVSGKNRTTFEEMVRLDIKYGLRQSLWLDLRIILATVPAIWMQFRDVRAARRDKAAAPAPTGQGPAARFRRSIPVFDYES